MKNLIGLGFAVSMAALSMACGSSPQDSSNTLHVTGSVDTQYRSLDNARAIALGSDGRAFSAYLTQTGRFTLDLPVGHVYRIVIANSTMSGELRMIGHLVNMTSDGKSASIAAREGGTIRLGALRPSNVAGASTTHTACECPDSKDTGYGDKGSADTGDKSGDDYGDKSAKGGGDDDGDKSGKSGGDDGGDDYKCEQKDADKDKTCDDGDDVDLEPEYSPGDTCKADADADEKAPAPKASSCSTKDGDKDGKDDGAGDSKGGDDSYGDKGGADDSSSKDDSADDSSSKDDGTYGGGDKGGASAGSCTCSLECGSGSSCVASKCTAAPTK